MNDKSSKLVSMSPELADKAHELICQLVGSFGDGISYELQHDFRQWLVDVADYAKKPPIKIECLRAALEKIVAQESKYGTMTIREASDLARKTLKGSSVDPSGNNGDTT